MAQRRRPASDTQPDLRASARIIQLPLGRPRQVFKAGEPWQRDAARFYGHGTLKFASNYAANLLSKIHLYVGERPSPTAEVKEVKDRKANRVLARLQSRLGGQPEVQRVLALNLFVLGECYGVPWDEFWEIRSIEEVKVNSRGDVEMTDPFSPDAAPRVFRTGQVARIWNRHPFNAGKADSFVGGVLDELEIIERGHKMVLSTIKNRIANTKILLVNDRIDFGPLDPSLVSSADENDKFAPFLASLFRHWNEALAGKGAASEVTPLGIQVADQLLKDDSAMKVIDLGSDLSETLVTRIAQAVESFARGVNLPPEAILGLGSTNMSVARQIDIDRWKAHLEPLAINMCDALTQAYFRPRVPNREWFIWFDPGDVISDSQRQEVLNAGHDRLAISDEVWRAQSGFTEEARPTEEEYARRVSVKKGALDPPYTIALLSPTGTLEGLVPAAEPPPAATDQPAVPQPGRPTADVAASILLCGAAEQAIERLLEKAGARIARKAQSHVRAKILTKNLSPRDVAPTLGAAIIAELGFDIPVLLDDPLTSLHRTFIRHYDPEDWGVFRAGILELAARRLFAPAEDLDPVAQIVASVTHRGGG